MPRFDFKKIVPHLYIIAGFVVISLLYCYPAIQGQVLSQHDVVSWKAMYHETEMYHDSTGINPLWTNSIFSGMPTYTIGVPESNNYVGYLQVLVTSVLVKPAYFLFLALLGFYILGLVIGVNRLLAAVGALAYAFATYNVVIISAGHDTKMLALAYMPAVLAGLILIYRYRWLEGAVLMGVSLSLMVGTNHFQVLYYALILFFVYFLAKLVIALKRKEDMKMFGLATLIAGAIALVAAGTAMASILTTNEYAKTTMRGGESELTINHDENKKKGGLDKDYAFNWSNGIGETLCLMIPNLYGGSSGMPIDKAPETESLVGSQVDSIPMYWGPQPFVSGPVYFGAIICFLFVLGIIVIRSPHKWWIIGLSLVTIAMSWGKNFAGFNYWLFDHLPMYNKFRTPTMILVIPQLLFPLLGIWAVSDIIRGKMDKESLWKSIKLAAGITAGLCVIVGLGASMFFDFSNASIDQQLPPQILSALKSDRASLATKSALTSAVYILLAAALLWAFIKEKVGTNVLIAGLGLLIAVDLISTDSNFLNESNYEDATAYDAVFQPRPVDQQIMQDPDPYYRVLDLSRNTYNDAIQAYFHKCIGGYSPAKMEIYQDLIDMQIGGAHAQGKWNSEVLNMLNTKYIIFNGGPQQQPVAQKNSEANGNAWFVDEIRWAKTADEEMSFLDAPALGDTATTKGGFDSRKTAILRENNRDHFANYQFGKDSAAQISLTRYGLNDLTYVSQNTQQGFGVFSDIWYPYGWEAFVDGQPVEIFRVNYVLRAIKIPAGKHEIAFHFRPQSFATGNTIALVSNLILLILCAGLAYVIWKGKMKQEPVDPDPSL